MVETLHFKSNREAFEYALQHSHKNEIRKGQVFTGIVEQLSSEKYTVEIICKSRSVFKKKYTATIEAFKHFNIKSVLNENDLVLVGVTDISNKVPSGFIVAKLLPELDVDSNQLQIAETIRDERTNNNIDRAINFVEEKSKFEIDHTYGLLLPESEIIESEEAIYFCQTNRNQLVAGWKKDNQTFDVNIDRSLLEGLSFSTPKRFEQFVFGKSDKQLNYRNKQYLIEYLLQGIELGDYKTLTKKTDNASRIEFSLGSKTWNEMLIGKLVGVEWGLCKYFEKNATEERFLNFALLCDNWNVTIEFLLGDYEDFEQQHFMLKQFDNYYSN